ncbi:hypothetical protein GHT06_013476 [Daphnia sinensis]|uniref:Uncharacterized protein n=1 Tax=Daphnia sinensis TaxID=1820382 RepID=A0AAD5PVC7_9CRUS|nr:hypothetical protein GHT06_013476 [Daphnia sinensis]
MTEAVAKSKSIETCGNISKEDKMKPEAVEVPSSQKTISILPDNDFNQKRGKRNAGQRKLMNQLRKLVADHKMEAIRLKKLQVEAWGNESIRIYEEVKDLHHKYMESLPDITDPLVKKGGTIRHPSCESFQVYHYICHIISSFSQFN